MLFPIILVPYAHLESSACLSSYLIKSDHRTLLGCLVRIVPSCSVPQWPRTRESLGTCHCFYCLSGNPSDRTRSSYRRHLITIQSKTFRISGQPRHRIGVSCLLICGWRMAPGRYCLLEIQYKTFFPNCCLINSRTLLPCKVESL